MRKRKKIKKSRIRLFPFLLLALVGYIGWYYTGTKNGTIASIILFIFLVLSFKIWRKTRGYAKLRKAGIKQIDTMTGEEFEQYLGVLFRKRGFKVAFTKTSGDYGADLILKDRNEVIAVQAKRYSGSVGVKAVQEIIGALKMYDASQAWVVTNSYFTKQAEKLAEANDVYLINRDELIEMILKKR
ncbi:restriction endonuclease [Lysinibacillus sp. BW-2-10]|uniref:restriction endonuclease n=1 Tax=Lysinibacillus sp. BW-2-10 TaxID=2590030 RepID=UPI0011807EC3|nr:restriction endonuclease [Lysinibacillus sp. BW-2-10]TSI08288.1 restriction endonuclease [Lysinibacillus sp. BW-2-10]